MNKLENLEKFTMYHRNEKEKKKKKKTEQYIRLYLYIAIDFSKHTHNNMKKHY